MAARDSRCNCCASVASQAAASSSRRDSCATQSHLVSVSTGSARQTSANHERLVCHNFAAPAHMGNCPGHSRAAPSCQPGPEPCPTACCTCARTHLEYLRLLRLLACVIGLARAASGRAAGQYAAGLHGGRVRCAWPLPQCCVGLFAVLGLHGAPHMKNLRHASTPG